jgi:hypothetical protein
VSRAAVRDLVQKLSDSSNETRAKAAEALRPLLAADPASAPNWHDKSFWVQRIEKTQPDTTLDAALAILLPDLSADERKKRSEGGGWSGGTGTEVCRLDDYWWATFQLKDFDKKLLIERPKLVPHVQQVWVKPPDHFTGLWVIWRVNGQKADEIQYRDGKYDGTLTAFHDDGSKAYVQHSKQGVSDGPDTGWFKSGKKMYEGQHKNNKQDGKWRHWYENGQLASEVNYKDGEFDGTYTTWFEDGQKQYEEHYRKGKRDGFGTAWDEHGTLLWKRMYRNDEVIEAK